MKWSILVILPFAEWYTTQSLARYSLGSGDNIITLPIALQPKWIAMRDMSCAIPFMSIAAHTSHAVWRCSGAHFCFTCFTVLPSHFLMWNVFKIATQDTRSKNWTVMKNATEVDVGQMGWGGGEKEQIGMCRMMETDAAQCRRGILHSCTLVLPSCGWSEWGGGADTWWQGRGAA